MAFKLKGFSGFGDKIKIARAKRLAKKYVGHNTVDSGIDYTDEQQEKAEKKMIKADRLLEKAGYNLEQREGALGAEGYKTSMDWAENKINYSETGEGSTYQIKKNKTIIKGPKGKVVLKGNDKIEMDRLLNR